MKNINLLRSRAKKANVEMAFDTSIDLGGGGGGNENNKEALLKLGIMLLFAVILYIYEGHNIDTLKQEASGLKRQSQQLKTKLEKGKAEAAKADEAQKKINELEAKIGTVKKLSRIRLNELKALDYLQNIIPEKVWLTNVDYNDRAFEFQGGSLDDASLSDFITRMQGRSHFRDVVLIKASEQTLKGASYKVFTISSRLGGEK